MSQKFSHTEETLVKGAIHSQKSRCQIKNGNGCTGVKSTLHRKNPLRLGKILTVVRKLLLIFGALKSDRSYHRKKIIEFHTDWDLGDGTVFGARRSSVLLREFFE
jgi:hypothetical protein